MRVMNSLPYLNKIKTPCLMYIVFQQLKSTAITNTLEALFTLLLGLRFLLSKPSTLTKRIMSSENQVKSNLSNKLKVLDFYAE